MKKKAPILIFILGGLILTYPFYAQAFNRLYDSYNLSRYLSANQHDFEVKKERLLKENDQLQFNAGSDPFSNLESGLWETSLMEKHAIGTVVIPKIRLEVPLFDTTTTALLERGATVLNGTSQPLGIQNSHSVITAHRGLPNRELFTNITKLEIGDTFIISSYGSNLTYEVDRIEIVEPHETEKLTLNEGEDRVTLITCTPYMINTHRLLVSASRNETRSDSEAAIKTTKKAQTQGSAMILGAVALALILSTYVLVSNKKKSD